VEYSTCGQNQCTPGAGRGLSFLSVYLWCMCLCAWSSRALQRRTRLAEGLPDRVLRRERSSHGQGLASSRGAAQARHLRMQRRQDRHVGLEWA
jgi:hypothetical protein